MRFAFLVSPNNTGEILSAIKTCTVLWGGMFNALVPVVERITKRWSTARTGSEVVRGYLEAFEPDFVVTGSGVDPAKYGVTSSTSFPLASVSTKDGLRSRGMTAMPVYHWRHEQELRFVQREAVPLRVPRLPQAHLALWSAAAFGAFPNGDLQRFSDAYRQLGAEDEDLRQETYLDTLLFAYSPLNFANLDLERTSYSRHDRTYILLNHRDPIDVIDFWNLRALGWDVVSVPAVWAMALAPRITALGGRRGIHLLKARSIDDETFKAFTKAIEAPNGLQVQDWYPRMWERDLRDSDHVRRCELSAARGEQEVTVRDGRITFTSVSPRFVERSVFDPPRFMNVVRFRSFDMHDLATTVPRELRDLGDLLKSGGFPIGNTSEGITVRTDFDDRVTLRAPTGLRVFETRFASLGAFQLSSAGRVANRMLQLVGGPEQISIVANVDLVRMLEATSGTPSRDIPHAEIFGRLMRLFGNRGEVAERRLKIMLGEHAHRDHRKRRMTIVRNA
jgi:hypothetical protein